MKVKLKYTMGIKVHEDGMKEPVYSYKDVEKSYIKVYGDVLKRLAEVQGCPRNLIMFMAQEMDEFNTVSVNQYFRDRFVEKIGKDTDERVTYSDVIVKTAVKKLRDSGLIRQKFKGVYFVNPEYFFKGSNEQRRYEMVKEYLEAL